MIGFVYGLQPTVIFSFKTKPNLSHARKNDLKREILDTDREKIEKLMPLDLWLYEYATRLFDARWHHMTNGKFIEPDIPPFPTLTCFSTRFMFGCKNDEFSPFLSPVTPKRYLSNFRKFFTETNLHLP